MNVRCNFESPLDGRLCKRWAMRGSNFCYHHQPPRHVQRYDEGAALHPLARLSDPEDVFDVLRETLNATRQGRITPGQAYAVGFLAQKLLQAYDRVRVHRRDEALSRQFLPTLADEDLSADAESALAMPLPVATEEPAAAPPAPNTAHAEASGRDAEAREAQPRTAPELLAEIKRAAAMIAAQSKAKAAAVRNGA